MEYSTIKENPNKTLQVKKDSIDAWKLGEIMWVIGYDKRKSNFSYSQIGLDVLIDSGTIVFSNGAKVKII